MNISRRSVLTSGTLAVGALALGARPFERTSDTATIPAGSLAQVASTSSTPAVGIALGSGYQAYFASLSSSAQQSEIARMKAANIAWVRMDADWNDIQNPEDGVFDFAVPNATAAVLLAAGMNLDILLYESPTWARLAAGAAPLNSPWPTPDPSLYAKYCAAAAKNFSAMGVHTFELWNEPNLDTGYAPLPKLGTPSGWGYLSPLGFADLAVAAYPAIKAADPEAFVLGGTLANHDEYGYGGATRGASWAQITAGSTTAQISCTTANPADLYMLVADADGLLPPGTHITAVVEGVGYTVGPPAWQTTFTTSIAAVSSSSPVTVHVSFGYAPELFLTQTYARAAGQPMWDALAIHPYTQSYLPASQPVKEGGFTVIPALRNIMAANGESAKPMWITEIGAATGKASAVWPATAAAGTSLAVTSPNATTDDVHYLFVALDPTNNEPLVPTGSFVWDATAGGGWTVLPPTGLVLSTPLTSGTAIISLTVAATKAPLTIQPGTLVKVTVVPGDSSGVTSVVKTTTTNTTAITTSTTTETTIPVSSVTPTADYPAGTNGSVIQASIGQTFGTAIAAGAHLIVYVYPPGVAQDGAVSETSQADIITQTFTAIETGVPADASTGVIGAGPWSYVQAVFVYCWSDAGGTAGPFGLTRADGTSKPALAALTAAAG